MQNVAELKDKLTELGFEWEATDPQWHGFSVLFARLDIVASIGYDAGNYGTNYRSPSFEGITDVETIQVEIALFPNDHRRTLTFGDSDCGYLAWQTVHQTLAFLLGLKAAEDNAYGTV